MGLICPHSPTGVRGTDADKTRGAREKLAVANPRVLSELWLQPEHMTDPEEGACMTGPETSHGGETTFAGQRTVEDRITRASTVNSAPY